MSDRTIRGNRPVFSASNALDAVGRALHEIKSQDNLTWADIGAVLGVSEDQAAKYANGMATMSFVTFLRGKREWNGRFTGYGDRLAMLSRPGSVNGHVALAHMLSASSSIAAALADGELTTDEIIENRPMLEAARDEIDGLLSQIRIRAA
jgi:hypothetical protein